MDADDLTPLSSQELDNNSGDVIKGEEEEKSDINDEPQTEGGTDVPDEEQNNFDEE